MARRGFLTAVDQKGALDGIESVKKSSPHDERYERKVAANGQHYFHYFVLTATNTQVIGTSEQYSSKQAMEGGIAAVKKLGPGAGINNLV